MAIFKTVSIVSLKWNTLLDNLILQYNTLKTYIQLPAPQPAYQIAS